MFESNRLKSAFSVLLGKSGATLYGDAQQAENSRMQTLDLGVLDVYSGDNIPLQARISITGLPEDGDTHALRSSVIQNLKQQLAQKTAQELGIDQGLNAIRSVFLAETEHKDVSITLPAEATAPLAQNLTAAVRQVSGSQAEVRLQIEATFAPKSVERFYARQSNASPAAAKPGNTAKSFM